MDWRLRKSGTALVSARKRLHRIYSCLFNLKNVIRGLRQFTFHIPQNEIKTVCYEQSNEP